MIENLLELAYRLTQAGEPFVVATVVWCERPTSAKPGAQAIVQADGTMTGWIGGSCAQPVVLRENMKKETGRKKRERSKGGVVIER